MIEVRNLLEKSKERAITVETRYQLYTSLNSLLSTGCKSRGPLNASQLLLLTLRQCVVWMLVRPVQKT